MSVPPRISTLAQLEDAVRRGEVRRRSVKDEVRENLVERLRRKETLFPGIIGYDDTVVPQLANAILARHHFILLGLRGQAKTRILRALTTLLDEWLPVIPGSEVNDDPMAPLSAYGRAQVAEHGGELAVQWLPREARYIEKLATPDVTIADMIGDIDPIKAARSGLQLGSELAMHFGLMPRANRGVFAINELPDLAGKIQVGLFNVLQEGDVQIKGFPVRMPLDIMVVFSANPEDYTARGKIITPLKDRIGAEIRTHYLDRRADAMAVTAQEAWTDRGTGVEIPSFVREAVEEVAFEARQDRRVDKRSGVSQRLPISMLESVVSNAERRALAAGETVAVPRITDLYAAIPSITGKMELEYEGELKGADQISRELVRGAVSRIFEGHFPDADMRQIVDWFELGGSLDLDDLESAEELVRAAGEVQGLLDMARRSGVPADAPDALVASGVDFVLEGLYSQKKISRSEGRGFHAAEVRRPPSADRRAPILSADEDDMPEPSTRKKKRYYN